MKEFLKRIQLILDKNEEISKLKQENFNLFSLLRNESDEEKLHSTFICELLNPNGSHLLGDLFLKEFIDYLKLDFDFTNTNKIEVKKEKVFENGRIDIFIKNSSDQIIVIENKIYAVDQNKQLKRYHEFINKSKMHKLFYLTLWGNEAQDSSKETLKLDEDYFCLSYKDDILTWLNNCLKYVVDYPILRETLKQYIFLIKKLTNQLNDKTMENEIIQEISNNYKAAKSIANNLYKAEKEIVKIFFKELGESITNELNDDKWQIKTLENADIRYANCISIQSNDWPKDVIVKIQGETYVMKNPCVTGVVIQNSFYNREEITKLLKDKLSNEFNKDSVYFPFYNQNLNIASKIEDLFNLEKRGELVLENKEILINLVKIIDNNKNQIKAYAISK